MQETSPDALSAVASATTDWIEETEGLLGQAQAAMESLRFHPGVAPDAQHTIYQLLVLLRQRRSDAPSPEAVQVWLRALSAPSRLKGPAQFLNARGPQAPAATPPA